MCVFIKNILFVLEDFKTLQIEAQLMLILASTTDT